ncbi:MAG: hypothetical protein AAFR61_20715 [Bacteroidota bacterium]
MKRSTFILSLIMLFGLGSLSAQKRTLKTPDITLPEIKKPEFMQRMTPGVTAKQFSQQVRIKTGKQSGELTRKESFTLQKQQLKIQRLKKKAKKDGKVTDKERARIKEEQLKANELIREEKHDRQARKKK